MARFIDEIGLFAVGSAHVPDTDECDVCGRTWEGVEFSQFGDLKVCKPCYGRVEVWIFDHMVEILAWLRQRQAFDRSRIEFEEALAKGVIPVIRPLPGPVPRLLDKCGQLQLDPDCNLCGRRSGEKAVEILGGLLVGDCCFHIIDEAIWHRLEDITPWYRRVVSLRRQALDHRQELINQLTGAVKQTK